MNSPAAPLDATSFTSIQPWPPRLKAAAYQSWESRNDFDGNTRNVSTPDVGGDEFAGILLDLSAPSISYTPLANTGSLSNRVLTATITDPSGVASGGLAPRIYFKKSTDGSYVSTQCSGSSPTYTCTIDNSLIGGGSVSSGDIIQYFVVAQDTLGNVGANPSAGFAATDVNTVTTPPTTPNSYTILALISGSRNVGVGGDHTTLTAAIAELNAKELNGALTLTLTDATYPTESFPRIINANVGSSATNTVTIVPATGVSPTISGSSASTIIRVNGASYVTIDGSNSGARPGSVEAIEATRDLTITNTSTATATAAIQINSLGAGAGATNVTIKNANLSCGADQSTSVNVTYGISQGGITLGTSGADNDNNSFINNAITKVNVGIFSSGESAANPVQNTVIANNTIGPGGLWRQPDRSCRNHL